MGFFVGLNFRSNGGRVKNNMKEKIIIDCDPGTDDALVIAMALANSNLEILGITTVAGNRDVDKCTINALKVLEYFKSTEIPVYKGLSKPIARELFIPPSTSTHGVDGLGDSDFPFPKISYKEGAVEFIKEQIEKYPNEVNLFGIGPLSNITKVFQTTNPSLIKKLYLMNGAFFVPGNASEFAEFNAFIDPEAADIVYKANIPTKVVGLDVTNPVFISKEEFNRLKNYNSSAVKFFIKINENSVSRKKKDTFSFFWDSILFSCFENPDLIQSKLGKVTIEIQGEKVGMTKFYEGVGNIEVGTSINVPQFFDILYKFFGIS